MSAFIAKGDPKSKTRSMQMIAEYPDLDMAVMASQSTNDEWILARPDDFIDEISRLEQLLNDSFIRKSLRSLSNGFMMFGAIVEEVDQFDVAALTRGRAVLSSFMHQAHALSLKDGDKDALCFFLSPTTEWHYSIERGKVIVVIKVLVNKDPYGVALLHKWNEKKSLPWLPWKTEGKPFEVVKSE